MGDYAQSVKYWASSIELRGSADLAKFYRDSFANGGWDAFLRAITQAPTLSFGHYRLALAHVDLGEIDAAFAQLNASMENHEQSIGWLKVQRSLQPLHNDPRFVTLLKRVGFPE